MFSHWRWFGRSKGSAELRSVLCAVWIQLQKSRLKQTVELSISGTAGLCMPGGFGLGVPGRGGLGAASVGLWCDVVIVNAADLGPVQCWLQSSFLGKQRAWIRYDCNVNSLQHGTFRTWRGLSLLLPCCLCLERSQADQKPAPTCVKMALIFLLNNFANCSLSNQTTPDFRL